MPYCVVKLGDVLTSSVTSRFYIALHEKHAAEGTRLLAQDPRLAAQAASLLRNGGRQ